MSKSNILFIVCFLFITAIALDSYFFHIYITDNIALPVKLEKYANQDINYSAKVVREPDKKPDNLNITVGNEKLGRVLVTTELGADYQYGDVLEISGKLLIPKVYDDFDYRHYLAKDGIYFVMYYPKIKKTSEDQGFFYVKSIFKLKNKMRESIDKNILPPQSSILKAIFLGDKQNLTDKLKEKLNTTGTRHIVAISGLHLIILSQIILYFLLGLGLWRQQAFYIATSILFVYLILIGIPASALRAFIFIFLLLLSQQLGRIRSVGMTVFLAAAVMLVLNPQLLKSDVGFQFSFAATLGIIYVKPLLDKVTDKIANPLGLRDILAVTMAAQIAVLGLLVYHFGRISLISPLANILIVPWLPYIIIGGIIISFTGIVWLSLAKLLSWPLWVLLTCILKMINLLAQPAWADVNWSNFSPLLLLLYYLILGYLVYISWKKLLVK